LSVPHPMGVPQGVLGSARWVHGDKTQGANSVPISWSARESAISEHVTDMGHDIKLTGQGMSMDHLMAKGSRNTVESE